MKFQPDRQCGVRTTWRYRPQPGGRSVPSWSTITTGLAKAQVPQKEERLAQWDLLILHSCRRSPRAVVAGENSADESAHCHFGLDAAPRAGRSGAEKRIPAGRSGRLVLRASGWAVLYAAYGRDI